MTAEAKRLACASYDERGEGAEHLDATRLAVLSDALEEAGCTDADILSHLRDAGLAVYKLPELIEYMDELPRNPVGKLLKRDIRTSVRESVRSTL
jgi:acyl-CoA synthetase (AMP-forming)/AMP-acid ligase II